MRSSPLEQRKYLALGSCKPSLGYNVELEYEMINEAGTAHLSCDLMLVPLAHALPTLIPLGEEKGAERCKSVDPRLAHTPRTARAEKLCTGAFSSQVYAIFSALWLATVLWWITFVTGKAIYSVRLHRIATLLPIAATLRFSRLNLRLNLALSPPFSWRRCD
jgi:hypothetical protein